MQFDYGPYLNKTTSATTQARTLQEMEMLYSGKIAELDHLLAYLQSQKVDPNAEWLELSKHRKRQNLIDYLTNLKTHVEAQLNQELKNNRDVNVKDGAKKALLNRKSCLSYAKAAAALEQSRILVEQTTSIEYVSGNDYKEKMYTPDVLKTTATNYRALMNDMEGANNGWRSVSKAMMAVGAVLATIGVAAATFGAVSFATTLGLSTPVSAAITSVGIGMALAGSLVTIFGYVKNKRSGLSAKMDGLLHEAEKTEGTRSFFTLHH